MSTNNAINLNAAGITGYDGAGSFVGNAVTNHAVQVGGATSSSLTSLTVGTNGQVLVGSTAANPVFATLTGSGGITFTTGAGTLQINNSGGGFSWTDVTGTSQAMSVNNAYVADNAGLVTLTLPTTAAIGDTVIVQGKGAGGWKITYTTNQQIQVGSSASTVTTGNIASTNQWDSITLTCVTTNNIWAARGLQGNITIA